MSKCLLCGAQANPAHKALIMNKHEATYLHCDICGLLYISEPHWLDEAYANPINMEDTGILARNTSLSLQLADFLPLAFNKEAIYLDFAGGYGFLTRLMRDKGFNFYWHDKYTQNLTAIGFEGNLNQKYSAITCFEAFEHFTDPLSQLSEMLKYSNTIIFTTELLPEKNPAPQDWWYYGLSHGQHITFYSKKTMLYLASTFNLSYIKYKNLHILTNKNISKIKLFLAKKRILKTHLKSKTFDDMLYIASIKSKQIL